ncbi:MAG: nucleotidyltransferase [Alphaproteobacteria bacterium]|nr:nucleotidyltransferase [Alphaproteobacteria bacterium]
MANKVLDFFQPVISQWAGSYLNDFFVAGSSAKGVSIKGKSDVDLFISIKSSCTNSLSDIYFLLFNRLVAVGKQKGFSPCQQNVSIGIKGLTYGNRQLDIDIVPARQQEVNSNFHSLYKSKQNTWTQTNVKGHINLIRNSGRQDFIRLIKIWRECHQLDFPSMNIELSVLKALHGCSLSLELDVGFRLIMNYLSNTFFTDNLVDPFNSANIVSNDMTNSEKQKVVIQAKEFFTASDWRQIIW